MPEVQQGQAPVALVFDYASAWAWATQPQGRDFDYFRLVFAFYRGLRRLGLSVDIVPPDTASLVGYRLVLAPGVATLSDPLKAALAVHDGLALVGPRTNAKTADFAIPVPLPPALPGLDAVVARVESLPPDLPVRLTEGGAFLSWREKVQGGPVIETTADGWPALVGDRLRYLCGWPDDVAMDRILRDACDQAGVPAGRLPPGLRCRDAGETRFWINYAAEAVTHDGRTIPGAGVLWEQRTAP
jgi:beta-galactosidase